MSGSAAIDLTGQRFGQLVVLQRAANIGRSAAWLCRCDCGTTKVIRSYMLRGRRGQQGCGCLRRLSHLQHGGTHRREYHVWMSAKMRCSNPNDVGYKRYGGRGITMDPVWRDSFETFFRDMGPCPEDHSIDRIDNDGPYAPGNCRWVKRDVQANNHGRNRHLTIGGERLTIAEASRRFNIPYSRLKARIDRGWPTERAIA